MTGETLLDRLEATLSAEKATPLRRIPLPGAGSVVLFGKDESQRPSGSLKHGQARALLRHALRQGELRPGMPVVVASSGNLAVSVAYFARLLGLPCTAVVPGRTGAAKLARIEQQGGQWLKVDPPLAVYERAGELATSIGGHYLDHLNVLGPALDDGGEPELAEEILADLAALDRPAPAWIVAGVGSGATARVLGRGLRRAGAATRLALVDPENSAYFPGWASGCADYGTGMPSRVDGIGRPRIEPPFDPDVVDLVIPVPDAESLAAQQELHDLTGWCTGPSTGTCLHGARHLLGRMRERGERGSVVLLIADAWPAR